MPKLLGIVCILISCITLCGCVHEHVIQTMPDGLVDKECILKPIELKSCDFNKNPPNCKHIRVVYKEDNKCFRIVINNGSH